MTNPARLRRLAARAEHLDLPDAGDGRRDPVAVIAEALAPLRWTTLAVGAVLLGVAVLAPRWTGAVSSALLAGVPGVLLLLLAALASPPRCRACMILATAACGFLAIGTCAGLGALGELGGPRHWAVLYQLVCFVAAAIHLAVGLLLWRRAAVAGAAAEARRALYDEL